MKSLITFTFTLMISTILNDRHLSMDLNPDNQYQKPLFSFGLIADIQYCDCVPTGTRYYRSSLVKLEEAVKSLRIDSPLFIINLGDMIEKDFASYKLVYSIMDTSAIRFYHTIGNHDYMVEPRQKKRIPPLQSNREGYYSFYHDNFRFIVLNGNELSTYSSTNKSGIKEAVNYISKLKTEGAVNGMDWNGGISSKQIQWLTNQLNTASGNGEKVFIICHFPVYPENEHNLLNYKDLLSVLESYNNIIAWFNGHNHAGNYGNFNLIHFVTMKGMVETENTNSYALVEVYKNKIWIKGYDREKSQILAY
jgi:manganese-dependent ADP-ribose/CDP-alcohol diphosphatase